MSYSQKRESKYYEEEARNLVKSVTGFQEDEENFQLSLQFTLSNFLYHRFLDVNSHQVQRTVDGLCEKLLIHCLYEKAEALRLYSTSFLNVVSKADTNVRETAYAVLSLLLHLSKSPISKDYGTILLSEEERVSKESEIDWTQYLLEGEEAYTVLSDEDQDWSEDEEEDSLEEIITEKSCPPRRDDSGIDISPESSTFPSQSQIQTSEIPLHSSRQTLLHQHLVTPYWNPQYQITYIKTPSKTLASNFTKEWEKNLERDTLVYTPGKNAVLTEKIVIREVLWMLHGVKDLYLFSWDEQQQFKVKKDVHLSHVTAITLCNTLNTFCDFGNKAVRLHKFLELILNADANSPFHCLTYQAYAASLSYSLQQFSSFLTTLEKQLIKQDKTLTITELFQKLKPHLDNLELMTYIYNEGIEKIPPDCPPWERAVRLLTVLWKHLMQHSIWMSATSTVQLILPLFLKTCCPYLNLLESLVSHGWLQDPYREFIIQRKENINVLDENFWDAALSLQILSADVGTDFFLKPLYPLILLAGKSMEMLRYLGHTSEVNSPHKDVISDTLYSQLLQNLNELLQEENQVILTSKYSETDEQTSSDDDYYSCPSDLGVQKLKDSVSFSSSDWLQITSEPLLQQSFQGLINTDVHGIVHHQPAIKREFQKLHSNVLLPLNVAVQEAVQLCIKKACHNTCRTLIKVLKEKYHLMAHIAAMKKYFLMESGDVMYSFYSEIFQKICTGDQWQDLSFLNIALQDAIAWQDKDGAERLSVFLDNSGQIKAKQPLSVLNTLQLVYEAQWPTEVILNSVSQNQYCQVFCFLLQVKCAKYVLDELRFSDLCKYDSEPVIPHGIKHLLLKPDMPRNQKIHSMFLFRMRLLHFVNGFHSYIMARILHSSGLELDSKLESAGNLDDVIEAHRRYLLTLHERCLLHPQLAFLREEILKVLNLSLSFQRQWQLGIDKVSKDELVNIENEFNRCHSFLMSYLGRPLKRGAFPHLEALASAVLSYTNLERVFSGT